MKFNYLSNIIIETVKAAHGTNKLIHSNSICNLYEAYPHFEERFKERYFGYTEKERYTKMAKAAAALYQKRIFK